MIPLLAFLIISLLLLQGDTGQLNGTVVDNLFNWTNFANPNNNIAVPVTFRRITATSAGARVIQFAVKVNF